MYVVASVLRDNTEKLSDVYVLVVNKPDDEMMETAIQAENEKCGSEILQCVCSVFLLV